MAVVAEALAFPLELVLRVDLSAREGRTRHHFVCITSCKNKLTIVTLALRTTMPFLPIVIDILRSRIYQSVNRSILDRRVSSPFTLLIVLPRRGVRSHDIV